MCTSQINVFFVTAEHAENITIFKDSTVTQITNLLPEIDFAKPNTGLGDFGGIICGSVRHFVAPNGGDACAVRGGPRFTTQPGLMSPARDEDGHGITKIAPTGHPQSRAVFCGGQKSP